MSNRLDKDREAKLQPERMGYAMKRFEELNIPIVATDGTYIKIRHKGQIITFYPYSGWFTGNGVTDGLGISNLLKQLK